MAPLSLPTATTAVALAALASLATAQWNDVPPANDSATNPWWPQYPDGTSKDDFMLNNTSNDDDLRGSSRIAQWIVTTSNVWREQFVERVVRAAGAAARRHVPVGALGQRQPGRAVVLAAGGAVRREQHDGAVVERVGLLPVPVPVGAGQQPLHGHDVEREQHGRVRVERRVQQRHAVPVPDLLRVQLLARRQHEHGPARRAVREERRQLHKVGRAGRTDHHARQGPELGQRTHRRPGRGQEGPGRRVGRRSRRCGRGRRVGRRGPQLALGADRARKRGGAARSQRRRAPRRRGSARDPRVAADADAGVDGGTEQVFSSCGRFLSSSSTL